MKKKLKRVFLPVLLAVTMLATTVSPVMAAETPAAVQTATKAAAAQAGGNIIPINRMTDCSEPQDVLSGLTNSVSGSGAQLSVSAYGANDGLGETYTAEEKLAAWKQSHP